MMRHILDDLSLLRCTRSAIFAPAALVSFCRQLTVHELLNVRQLDGSDAQNKARDSKRTVPKKKKISDMHQRPA